MYRSIALATVLSSAILAATGDTANAFHHRARAAYAAPYYPYYAGCCASSMMYGGGTYGGACMYGGGGCGNAYGSGCNTYLPCQGAAGGHRCCLRHRAKVAARRAFAGCLGGSGACHRRAPAFRSRVATDSA